MRLRADRNALKFLAIILLVVDRQRLDSGGGSQCLEMVLLFIHGISADAIVFGVEMIIDPLFEQYAGSTSKICTAPQARSQMSPLCHLGVD